MNKKVEKMIVTVELSLYPLVLDFEPHIIGLIKKLKSIDTIEVITNAMSTQVKGDWREVMRILTEELEQVYTKVDTCSTVIKIVNRDLPIEVSKLNF